MMNPQNSNFTERKKGVFRMAKYIFEGFAKETRNGTDEWVPAVIEVKAEGINMYQARMLVDGEYKDTVRFDPKSGKKVIELSM